MFPLLKAEGVNQTQACKAFHMDHRRMKKLVLEMGGKFDDELGGVVQDRVEEEAANPRVEVGRRVPRTCLLCGGAI